MRLQEDFKYYSFEQNMKHKSSASLEVLEFTSDFYQLIFSHILNTTV